MIFVKPVYQARALKGFQAADRIDASLGQRLALQDKLRGGPSQRIEDGGVSMNEVTSEKKIPQSLRDSLIGCGDIH